jgi:S-adenosylmethionine hydrolase
LRQREIATFRKTYAEGKEGELFVLPGSAGYLEIVVRNGSAAALLEAGSGTVIGVVLS